MTLADWYRCCEQVCDEANKKTRAGVGESYGVANLIYNLNPKRYFC